jgi:hypothetical protein
MSKKRLRARERIKQLEMEMDKWLLTRSILERPVRYKPPEIKEIYGAYQVPYHERHGQYREHHREQACVSLVKFLLAHRDEFLDISETNHGPVVIITARVRMVSKE